MLQTEAYLTVIIYDRKTFIVQATWSWTTAKLFRTFKIDYLCFCCKCQSKL